MPYEIININTKQVVHTASTLNECRKWARLNNKHSPDFYARRMKVQETYENTTFIDMSDISNM